MFKKLTQRVNIPCKSFAVLKRKIWRSNSVQVLWQYCQTGCQSTPGDGSRCERHSSSLVFASLPFPFSLRRLGAPVVSGSLRPLLHPLPVTHITRRCSLDMLPPWMSSRHHRCHPLWLLTTPPPVIDVTSSDLSVPMDVTPSPSVVHGGTVARWHGGSEELGIVAKSFFLFWMECCESGARAGHGCGSILEAQKANSCLFPLIPISIWSFSETEAVSPPQLLFWPQQRNKCKIHKEAGSWWLRYWIYWLRDLH